MHIYYDSTTFSLSTRLIILENNGEESMEIVRNNPKMVIKFIHKILNSTDSTKIFIHVRGLDLIGPAFRESFEADKRITIR